MKHDDLIRSLRGEARAWERVSSIGGSTRVFAIFALTAIPLIMMVALPLRTDFVQKLGENNFFFGFVSLFFCVATSVYLLPRLRVPGQVSKASLALGTLPLFLWSAATISRHLQNSEPFQLDGAICFILVTLLAIVPFIVTMKFLSRGVVLTGRFATLYAAILALGSSSLLMTAHCQNDHSWHITLWHFLPVVILISLVPFFCPVKAKL